MLVALVLVSLALVVCLGIIMFGSKAGAGSAQGPEYADAQAKARQKTEADLDKKRAEAEEQKAQLADLREQLKQAKRKLHEQKQGSKVDDDLAKEREAVERHASQQLDTVRAELAATQTELIKLRADSERGRRPQAHVQPAQPAGTPPAQPEAQKVQRVIRELSEADKEKMDRLEQQSAQDRAKAAELDRELKRIKSRTETQGRIYTVAKSELELVKDKYKALEKRLNRTLLQNDLLKRAMTALEKKSGVSAEHSEASAEQLAAEDLKTEERQKAELEAQAARVAQAELPPEAQAATEEPPTAG